jgi:hypothetical protein
MWPAEGDLTRAGRGGHKDLHPCHHALQRALHRHQADLHLGVLPQQDVMLEIDLLVRFEIDRQHRH